MASRSSPSVHANHSTEKRVLRKSSSEVERVSIQVPCSSLSAFQTAPTSNRKNVESVQKWQVCTGPVAAEGPRAIVYSFGLSRDFDVETGLARELALPNIHLFEPGEETREWFEQQLKFGALPSTFHLHSLALGPVDGTLKMRTSGSEFPAKRLHSIMKEMGHVFVDLIKLNVGGTEWKVLEEVLSFVREARKPVPFGQLLVEFHHTDRHSLSNLIEKLNRVGMKVFHYFKESNATSVVGFLWLPDDEELVHTQRHPLLRERIGAGASVTVGSVDDEELIIGEDAQEENKFQHRWHEGGDAAAQLRHALESSQVETVWDRKKVAERERVRREGERLREQEKQAQAREFIIQQTSNNNATLGFSSLAHPKFVVMLPSISGAHLIRERRY